MVQEARFAHLVGAARMGIDPAKSVVDAFGRTHDIANLFICDGSILPTQGSANPGLTIQALAARTADYLISQGTTVFNSRPSRYDAASHSSRTLPARHPWGRSTATKLTPYETPDRNPSEQRHACPPRCGQNTRTSPARHRRAGPLHFRPYWRRFAGTALTKRWRKNPLITIFPGQRHYAFLGMRGTFRLTIGPATISRRKRNFFIPVWFPKKIFSASTPRFRMRKRLLPITSKLYGNIFPPRINSTDFHVSTSSSWGWARMDTRHHCFHAPKHFTKKKRWGCGEPGS